MENRAKKTVPNLELAAKTFVWRWPARLPGKRLSAVRGKEIQLRPGRRIFLVAQDDRFDEIVWGGMALAHADGLLPDKLVAPLIGAHLLYRARDSLREYRQPLSGPQNLYREGAGQSLADSLLGDRRNVWKSVRAQEVAEGERGPRVFRRLLPRLLALGGGRPPAAGLPIGVTCMFALPARSPHFEESTGAILLRLGERVRQWWRRSPDGRRPKDVLVWMSDLFSHPGRAPLCASREELAYAVAYATHVSLASNYRYAMRELVQQVQPGLNALEKDLFEFYHWNTDLLGIPIQAMRRDYYEMVSDVVNDLLRRNISGSEVWRRAQQILGQHGLLKEDNLEQERAAKRRQSVARRRRDQAFRLRRKSRRKHGLIF